MEMDNILKSMYIRLDSTTKSLTKNAVSQLIIKILYASQSPLTKEEITTKYKELLNKRRINEEHLLDVLNGLESSNSVRCRKKRYYLTTNKKEKIEKVYQESIDRIQSIIDTYFKPFFSDESVVSDWLSQATMTFFRLYSNEWIADICYKNMSAIESSKENVLRDIHEQTLKDKTIDHRDRDALAKKFADFLVTKDAMIYSYLWEYGISSFAARLIANSNGADAFSINTFKDCKCVLDTNVLMHIGLENSEYYRAFKSLEEIFAALNINVGILYITQEEYRRAVAYKRIEILKSVEKFPFSVIKEASDQYVQTAISRGCITYEDFERFFEQLKDVPKFVDEKIGIEIFDDDTLLQHKIDKDQKDEDKLNALNAIFRRITGHDKRQAALTHDVGLISGVDYLRTKGKYFILSQEVSVNNYAKEKPSVSDIPISIRLETLINVLAVDNGGIDIDASDYTALFASIIRKGLTPSHDVFKITDLSFILERNEQIAQLPEQDAIEIAKEIHRKRLLGEDEAAISLEMTRKFQGAKLKIAADIDRVQTELSREKEDKERYKKRGDATEDALRDSIKEQIENEYSKKMKTQKGLFYIGVPVSLLLLGGIAFWIYKNALNADTPFCSYIVAILGEVILNALSICVIALPRIKKLKKDRTNYVKTETEKRLKDKMERRLAISHHL
jgi:predicted nucleic acid-binding protein